MSTSTTPGAAIPELWTRIIEAITNGPAAWMLPGEVASAIGLDEDATLDELASMDVAGLIDIWERSDGIAVTLSTLAADRLGYRIVEYGLALQHRWAKEGDLDPPPARAYHVVRSAGSASFDFLVDPRPGPADDADRSEQAQRFGAAGRFGTIRRGAGRGEPPRPTLLIGTGLVPWPGPPSADSTLCPACGSRSLPPNGYCLCCDRWGLDAEIPGSPRPGGVARNPGSAGFLDPNRFAEEANDDRRRRKERRGARLTLRFERQRRQGIEGRDRRRAGSP